MKVKQTLDGGGYQPFQSGAEAPDGVFQLALVRIPTSHKILTKELLSINPFDNPLKGWICGDMKLPKSRDGAFNMLMNDYESVMGRPADDMVQMVCRASVERAMSEHCHWEKNENNPEFQAELHWGV